MFKTDDKTIILECATTLKPYIDRAGFTKYALNPLLTKEKIHEISEACKPCSAIFKYYEDKTFILMRYPKENQNKIDILIDGVKIKIKDDTKLKQETKEIIKEDEKFLKEWNKETKKAEDELNGIFG